MRKLHYTVFSQSKGQPNIEFCFYFLLSSMHFKNQKLKKKRRKRKFYKRKMEKTQVILALLSFRPARILEIWSPLLNAWLKSKRVWNSETNGNQERTATGISMMSPIKYSYALPNSLIESQNPSFFINGLIAWPI